MHFVGGLVGVLLIGFLATEVMTGGREGLLYGGGLVQLGKQALAALVVSVYAFVVSFVLAKSSTASWASAERRGRDDRRRLHPARRDRLRRGCARAPAGAPTAARRPGYVATAPRDLRRQSELTSSFERPGALGRCPE